MQSMAKKSRFNFKSAIEKMMNETILAVSSIL